MDKLKDIKPIVEIPDNSFYIFIGVIILCLVVITFIIILFKKLHKTKPKYSFNLNNPKETAYKLIKIIREKEGSDKYIEQLHQYTYKKNVPPLDKKLFEEIIEKFDIKIS